MSRSGPSRRQMLHQAAALAGVPVAAATLPAAEGPAEALTVRAAALLEMARAQYGKHLTEEQLKSLARGILRSQLTADRLKRVPLANGDEPAAFQADLP